MLIYLHHVANEHQLVVADVHVGAIVTDDVSRISVKRHSLSLNLVAEIENRVEYMEDLLLPLSLSPWAFAFHDKA